MSERKRGKIRYSVQVKFIALFSALVLTLLLLMNIYPVITARQLVFTGKESTLSERAALITGSLAVLDTLTPQEVTQVIDLLEMTPMDRLMITDASARILYDTSAADERVGDYALFSEICRALEANSVFYCTFTDGTFRSRYACPVMSGGEITGAVYLYEYDETQGELIQGIQRNMRYVSLAVCLAALICLILVLRGLTSRVRELARGMRTVREGQYDYRLAVRGRDEVAELGQEFNQLTERLERTEEMRRRFVSDASHELKTPLAAIKLLTDSIVQSGEMDSGTMREFIADIGDEANRLQRISEKLLSLTRIDEDAEPAAAVGVDLKTVALKTLKMLGVLADQAGVTLESELADGCTVLAVEDDLYQVIFNLAENAIKYNVRGGWVKLTLFRQRRYVVLTVDDTGIGIPEEDIPHVFTRFYRVDKARSRERGGSGLGLSIVHDAVALYGGTVRAARRLPSGTRFTVSFPWYKGGEEANHAD